MTPFTWREHQEKSLQRKLRRSIHLARINPDYQKRFPSEARDNPDRKVLKVPHVEAVKRIEHEYKLKIKLQTMPSVERPTRLNKNVG